MAISITGGKNQIKIKWYHTFKEKKKTERNERHVCQIQEG